VTSSGPSLEDIEARVGRRERRNLVWTLALTLVLVAAAATLLYVSVGQVRQSEEELDEVQTLLLALLQDESQVTSASFHPDGKHVVTASAAGTARVWDSETGRVVAELRQPGHPADPISDANFSPDGRLLVTAGASGDAVVWDWRSKKVVTALPHDDQVIRAGFDPEGRRVVTAAGNDARVWDWRAAKVVATLRHATPVSSAAFGSGGRVVTGSADRARLWDVRATPPRLLAELPRPSEGDAVPILDARVGPDGSVITATTGAATIYDVEGGLPPHVLIHAGDVTSAAISPDGTRVLTTSSAGAALLWPRYPDDGQDQNDRPVVLREQDASTLLDAGFSPDGELVVVASSDATAQVYRPAKPARGDE
jgi:WD40 repeat protein